MYGLCQVFFTKDCPIKGTMRMMSSCQQAGLGIKREMGESVVNRQNRLDITFFFYPNWTPAPQIFFPSRFKRWLISFKGQKLLRLSIISFFHIRWHCLQIQNELSMFFVLFFILNTDAILRQIAQSVYWSRLLH